MNSTASAGPPVRIRWALIVASVFALFASLVVTAPAQAGYYDAAYSCPSYRCGYPSYRHYRPYRPRLIYERRYIERQYVERRYGYGGYRGYRRHYGYSPCGYRRHYGYSPCGYRRHYGYPAYGSYRSYSRPYGDGYGGVGRRWSVPYFEGPAHEYRPRPPAPIAYEGDYY